MNEPAQKQIASEGKSILRVMRGEKAQRIPFWLMRQAGRYLPEYGDLKEKAGGFMEMICDPSCAAEATMQPLRRYSMDAAILFSDILMIPYALGQNPAFVKDEGPKLDPLRCANDLARLRFEERKLDPVYEAITRVRKFIQAECFDDSALIGFAGAPWTVAAYMVEGGGSREMIHVKSWAYSETPGFRRLIGMITDATITHLSKQIESGAEAVQLFESWAGVADEGLYEQWVIEPAVKIVAALKEKHPDVPVVGFPRGSGIMYEKYAEETKIDVLGLDQYVPMAFAQKMQEKIPIQGNLDPVCLLCGGEVLVNETERILKALSGGPFIFNLGHGVMKQTPPQHVERLAKIVRKWPV